MHPKNYTRQFGLIGYPLGHSWSKSYFQQKFEKEQIEGCSYSLFPLAEIEDLPGLIDRHPDLCGLNVTIPYKERIIPLLDHLSETAAAIAAVNTILIDREHGRITLTGHNTDAYGFEKSLERYGIHHGGQALVLGSGGASKAVCWVLKKLGWEVSLVSRQSRHVTGPDCRYLNYEQLGREVMMQHRLIVNTTPLGMYPDVDTFPDIPYQWLTRNHILYDLVYNPENTVFLEFGKKATCTTIGGIDMLKLQADRAWALWNRKPA